VIRRVLKVLSEVRREFSLDPLEELQELSILAGKDACRMAAKDIPFGHDDINERQSAFPLALAYSENIALTPACADPGAETIMNWMGVSTTRSRMLSQFTHTGVGVAESQDGSWYVTQIYITLKSAYSEGDRVLLMLRFINHLRRQAELPPLSISLLATMRLREAPIHNPGFTPKDPIVDFSTYELQMLRFERKFKARNDMQQVFDEYLQRRDFVKMAKGAQYAELAFARRIGPGNLISIAVLLGRGGSVEPGVRARHLRYPAAAVMLDLVNAYRADRKLPPLALSHRWCTAAERHLETVLAQGEELQVRSLRTRITEQLSGTDVQAGAALLPRSADPLPELFLIWITNKVGEGQITGNATHFAFALGGVRGGACAALRVVGVREGSGAPPDEPDGSWRGIGRFADVE
jgi:uncharacterized protein YkwD